MNDDLISRKELYAAIVELADNADCNIAILPEVASLVRHAPAIDAVPVARCKDCTFKEKAEVNSNGFRICPASGMEITDDDFCSYGVGKRGYLHDESN